jgi:hypothetical protein
MEMLRYGIELLFSNLKSLLFVTEESKTELAKLRSLCPPLYLNPLYEELWQEVSRVNLFFSFIFLQKVPAAMQRLSIVRSAKRSCCCML